MIEELKISARVIGFVAFFTWPYFFVLGYIFMHAKEVAPIIQEVLK